MIHLLTVLNRQDSIGITLYDNKELKIQSDLLSGLVQALMLLGEEMGPVKGALREAELGKYQISILSVDHLAYVVVQDTYDSEPFTRKILENITDEIHDELLQSNFHMELPNRQQLRDKVKVMLQTMKFPMDLIEHVRDAIEEFQININSMADTILLSDLDDGVIEIFECQKNDTIVKLLMEILSEIPFERHWVGQTKMSSPLKVEGLSLENELWFIYRIGLTDFCIMGRAYYNTMVQRDQIVSSLEVLSDNISHLLMNG